MAARGGGANTGPEVALGWLSYIKSSVFSHLTSRHGCGGIWFSADSHRRIRPFNLAYPATGRFNDRV